MAYSIKIYDFNTGKSAAQIGRIWAEVAAKDSGSGLRESSRGTAGGSFRIRHPDGVLDYVFTIVPGSNILILQGPSLGRGAATKYLAEKIERAARRDVVREKKLDTPDMMRVFRNIVREDNSNIIRALTMFFEPQFGFQYSKETYVEISYRFTENRCASKHVDFDSLHKNSKAMNMVMRINGCAGISDGEETARLDAKRQCTFRMYRDVGADDWDEFCFKILGFLWEKGAGDV